MVSFNCLPLKFSSQINLRFTFWAATIWKTNNSKKAILENGSPIIYFFCYSILKYVKLILDLNKQGDNYPDIIRFSGNGANMFRLILSNESGVDYNKSLQSKTHSCEW